jgi:FkbM family methyltransferase
MEVSKTYNNGFVFNTLVKDWNIGENIRNGVIWEQYIHNFMKLNLLLNSTFIDVGSNYGYHSLFASKICKNVFSFEPQRVLYELQLKNITDNNIKNITLMHLGIGDNDTIIELEPINYLEYGNVGNLSVGVGGELVNFKKLDSLSFENVGLIKIDVQGYEKHVLNGMLELVKRERPFIIIEIESVHINKFGYNTSELVDLIRSLGYEVILMDSPYPSDHLCVPNEIYHIFVENNKHRITENKNNGVNDSFECGVINKITY